ncbi:MAG: hypothetical protein Q9226_002769 [Calogaya cf. arnoldii]
MGSAPPASKYWFAGALVCLVPRLKEPDVIKSAIVDAIRYGREECGRTSFNALLISIEDLVLLRSFPDGRVEHSDVMNLISTSGSSGLDAEHRYGRSWLNNFYELEMARREDAKRVAAEEEANKEKSRRASGAADSTNPPEQIPSTQQGDCTDEGETSAFPGEPEQDMGTQNLAETAIPEGSNLITEQHDEEATTRNDNAAERTAGGFDRIVRKPATTEDGMHTSEDASKALDEHADGDDQDYGAESAEIPAVVAEKPEAAEEDGDHHEEVGMESWDAGDTFLALVTFFNTTAHNTLKPVDGGWPKLPNEITGMILGHVTDLGTHQACMKVSRVFRSLCLKRPLLVDGVRLLKILPKSTETSDRWLRLLVEDSTGLPFDISIVKKQYYTKGSPFQFVIGKEWNRKSFCVDCTFLNEGLETPAPFDPNLFPQAEQTFSRPSYNRKDGPGVWDQAQSHSDIVAEGDIVPLGRFWERVAGLLFRKHRKGLGCSVIQGSHDKDWLMPADTKQFFIESDDYRHKKYQRFLLLRVKRASRYWDRLWHDIIQEDKELLTEVDDNYDLRRRNRKQLVGAANPAVILAVGLEVRLFEWDAASSILTETNPDRVYSVMDGEDIKVAKAVLKSAVERLETAKLKKEEGFHDEESDDDS